MVTAVKDTTTAEETKQAFKTLKDLIAALPKPKGDAPDFETVNKVRQQLETLWDATHTHWKELDAHLTKTNPLWVHLPETIRANRMTGIKRSGMAEHIINTVASQFLASDAKVHREPTGKGTAKSEQSGEIEDFTLAWLERTDRKGMEELLAPVKKYLPLYGYVVIKGVTLEAGTAEELPQAMEEGRAKRLFNPIEVSVPNPMTVLMDPRRKQPREVIELLLMTRGELAELAEANKHEYNAGDDRYKEVEAYGYWSNDWHCLYAQSGELILSERNLHRSPPFIQRFGPGGIVLGSQQDSTWLRYRCVGVLEPALDLLTQYDETLSAFQHYLDIGSYQKLKAPEGKDPSDAAQEAKGDVVIGDDWGYVSIANLPTTFIEIRDRLQDMLEWVTIPKHLSGFREPGVTTVGQSSQLNVSASRKFAPYMQVIEDIMGELVSRMFRLVMTWDHTVIVDGKKLDPDDLEGDDYIQISYPYVDPMLELEKRNEAKQSVRMGLTSWDGYQRTAGVENPDELREELVMDRIYQRPAIMEYMEQQALQKAGLAEIEADWQRKQQQMAQAEAAAQKPKLLGPRGQPVQSPMRQPVDNQTPGMPQNGQQVAAQMTEGM